MSQISLKNINKIYKNQEYSLNALRDLNLDIEKGEMIGIMGKSGSGKSTLLNILGLIDQPTSGEYQIDGKIISDYTPKEIAHLRNKKFGFVLQDFALIERYTVVENVKLPLRYSDVPGVERMPKVYNLLEELGLYEKKDMLPGYLSGGQRQRVAIARALINDAEIILADEPTGALDSSTGKEIMNLFLKMKQKGKTLIIVTHDKEIADYCDRIVTIHDGSI
ncbi:MAG: ABC transporter ATP-binding protein [Anaerostipes sp.]|nr:ABC transporter ATP-binding protein [Anaerostipes sp.]MDD3747676.1 ABC transporter ATP-binding protein [Anaerostipes sp.]